MKSYRYPLNFNALMKPQKQAKIRVEESVLRHIYLILMTNTGEVKANPKYGCPIWENDYNISVLETGWISEMKEQVLENIINDEPRIKPSVNVDIRIDSFDKGDDKNKRQEFIIKVSNMVLNETEEQIPDIEYKVMFSPISIE